MTATGSTVAAFLLASALLVSGCGGGGSTSPPPPPPPAASSPTFSPGAGSYAQAIAVTLVDATVNATIHYTTDGTTPTSTSPQYTGPVTLVTTASIKAIAVAAGFSPSPVASASYTLTPQTGSGPAVSVVLTTDDQISRMVQQPSFNFAAASGGNNVVVVDENETYQRIEGFGASFTDSAAYLLNQVATPSARNSAMNDLFTRNSGGIGLSFLRNPMGASDIARSQYSYDDGAADPTLANFSVVHDQADVIPLTLEAKMLNPQLKIVANPWSPPGWMKDSSSMIGGSLLPSMYNPFADYFVKYIQAYAAAGIPIDYISLQNEPLFVPSDYPGMSMDATTQTIVLRDHVLPALAANSIATKVLVYDHNWDGWAYPDSVLSDSALLASTQVAGIAWHGYGGTSGVMTTLHNKYPGKGAWETEHSGGTFAGDQVKTDFEDITQVMRNWSKSFVKWSLALDQNRGPHTGGCGTCSPLVTVNTTTGAVIKFIDYYTLGHFSRFVLPGATRIYSSNAQGIVTAAFLNVDGSKALVAFNDSDTSRNFQVQWGNESFGYTLPALSGATFTWNGLQGGGYAVNAKSQVQGSSFNQTSGLETEFTSDTGRGYDVGFADDGDYALFRSVDFGTGVSGVSARLACNQNNGGNCGGSVEFHLDSASGTLVAAVTVPATGDWQGFTTVSGPAGSASGVHDLYVVFKRPASGSGSLGNLNWFSFN